MTAPQPRTAAEQIRADLEASIRYRQHQEDTPGHMSWWSCIPVADIYLYQRLYPEAEAAAPLRAALERYLRHLPGCAAFQIERQQVPEKCDCGLRAALAQPEREAGE